MKRKAIFAKIGRYSRVIAARCIAAAVIAALVICLAGCAYEPVQRTGFALNTAISLTIYGESRKVSEAALDACFELCNALERRWSRTIATSDIAQLNATGRPADVNSDTAALIRAAINVSEASNGAFDITIGAVSELWDFNEKHVPDEKEIAKALDSVGYRNIMVNGDSIELSGGAKLDLGAIAKGAIAERLAARLTEMGVESAVINLGGNVHALGRRPDGKPFTIGIRSPWKADELLGVLELSDASVVTSGVYERGFEKDGRYYHHLLDPRTGYPAQSGLAAVSIVAKSSTLADALSTACFVLGAEAGMALAVSQGADAIFVLDGGDVLLSPGMGDYNFVR